MQTIIFMKIFYMFSSKFGLEKKHVIGHNLKFHDYSSFKWFANFTSQVKTTNLNIWKVGAKKTFLCLSIFEHGDKIEFYKIFKEESKEKLLSKCSNK